MLKNCPNCHQPVLEKDNICSNCGFNLEKYRQTFFATGDVNASKTKEETPKPRRRAAYQQEFYPDKQNEVVKKIILWLRTNAMIVFLTGIILMVLTSFSPTLGWVTLIILLIWLYFVCDRSNEIEQYIVDRRLTELVNRSGSRVFNSFEDRENNAKTKRSEFIEHHPKVSQKLAQRHGRRIRLNYVQLSVIIMAAISLIVVFSGSGASVSELTNLEQVSISRVILTLATKSLGNGGTLTQALILFGIWLILALVPLFIIFAVLENTKKGKVKAFICSLIETAMLIFVVFKLTSVNTSAGMISQLANQFTSYVVTIGVAAYLLILSSIMTTILSCYNIFKKTDEGLNEEPKK